MRGYHVTPKQTDTASHRAQHVCEIIPMLATTMTFSGATFVQQLLTIAQMNAVDDAEWNAKYAEFGAFLLFHVRDILLNEAVCINVQPHED